jgi:hypothetical protein
MQYQIDQNNQFNGSYTREEVQALIDSGQLDVNAKLWTAEWGAWRKLTDTDFVLSNADQQIPSGLPDNLFLSINGYLRSIDQGDFFIRVFQWVYLVFSVMNIFFPLYLLYLIVDNNVLDTNGKFIFLTLFVWLATAIAGWFSAQIWWDRRARIGYSSSEHQGYQVSHLFSNFIQTFGEWAGTYITIIGFVVALLANLFDERSFFSGEMDFLPEADGIFALVIIPMYGFLIIVSSRFVAEQIRALFTIASNVRSIRNKK